jgi:hypothetical protein
MISVTLHDLATMCGNEHMKKPRRANSQGRISATISFGFTTLTVTDIDIYSIEDLQVAQKNSTGPTMNQVLTPFQHMFGKPSPV